MASDLSSASRIPGTGVGDQGQEARGVKDQDQRVVTGQQLMRATSDIFSGWQHAEGPDGVERDFHLRRLRGKCSVVVEEMVPDGARSPLGTSATRRSAGRRPR